MNPLQEVKDALNDAELQLRFHQLSEPVNIKKFLERVHLTIEKVQRLHDWRENIES